MLLVQDEANVEETSAEGGTVDTSEEIGGMDLFGSNDEGTESKETVTHVETASEKTKLDSISDPESFVRNLLSVHIYMNFTPLGLLSERLPLYSRRAPKMNHSFNEFWLKFMSCPRSIRYSITSKMKASLSGPKMVLKVSAMKCLLLTNLARKRRDL